MDFFENPVKTALAPDAGPNNAEDVWGLLEMPVPVVLTLLWLLGVVLVATCAMTLYLLVAMIFGA